MPPGPLAGSPPKQYLPKEYTVRRRLASAAGAIAIGLLAAACSSGSTSSSATPAASSAASQPSSSPSAAAAQISLHSLAKIPAKALVTGNGRALYLFEADKNGKSTCTGACASSWPPYTVSGTAQAGPGVKQSLLGTIQRPDGTMQVTYNGHPLYLFTGDSGAGTANGEGSKAFGAGWYVVNANGSKIDTD
jgi:predicted lipoprotein with Yx(FWY)xxD motif